MFLFFLHITLWYPDGKRGAQGRRNKIYTHMTEVSDANDYAKRKRRANPLKEQSRR